MAFNIVNNPAGTKTVLNGSILNDLMLGYGVSLLGVEDITKVKNETFNGSSGNDQIYGGAGVDILNGGAGHDSLFGGTGDDKLYGDAGNDYLDGGAGNDSMDGGTNSDTLVGGAGKDTLLGGAANDWLTGGLGNDSIDGGAGTGDYAVFNSTVEDALTVFGPFGWPLTVTSAEGVDVVRNVEWLRFNISDGELHEHYYGEMPPIQPLGACPTTQDYFWMGVIARNDAFDVTLQPPPFNPDIQTLQYPGWNPNNYLGLTGADLLANDISLHPGQDLHIVIIDEPMNGYSGSGDWDHGDLVGYTNEGVKVYLDADDNLFLDPCSGYYDYIPQGEDYMTHFHYTASNGSQYTEDAMVTLTITGQSDIT